MTREPAPATKSWLNVGITPRAVWPSDSGSTGTSRQPRTARPSSAAISSMPAPGLGDRPRRRRAGTRCRRRTRAAAGRSKSTTARRNASGTWIRMPAPSPELGSAPAAPRWSRLRRAVSALRHDVVAGDAGQGRDERHATRIVLVAGVVEPLGRRECVRVRHRAFSRRRQCRRDPRTSAGPRRRIGSADAAGLQGTTLALAEGSGYHRVTTREHGLPDGADARHSAGSGRSGRAVPDGARLAAGRDRAA